MSLNRAKSGFTLVEIMIVVGIIAALAVLAIPNMLRSRMGVNETAAIASCRTIVNGCQVFYANSLPHTYPTNDLTDLIRPTSDPPYIDSVLAAAVDADHAKQGYYFDYDFVDSENFTVNARPNAYGNTGIRSFYTDEMGVITATSENRAATANDPAVE